MSLISESRKLIWRLHRRLADTATIRTRQGRLTISLRDRAIGKRLYCRREYELALTGRVLALLRAEGLMPPRGRGTLLDVGANMGVIAVGMLTRGELHAAIAVEPAPENVALLRRNIRQNGLADRCCCLPRAASDREGELTFELSETNFGDHRVQAGDARAAESFGESTRRTITVPARPLDALLDEPSMKPWIDDLALVWIDVQGHEHHVLRGARRLLASGVPIACEVWPYGLRRAGASPRAFAETVRGLRPRFWAPDGARFRAHPTAELDRYLAGFGDSLRYENLVFTHSHAPGPLCIFCSLRQSTIAPKSP